MGAFEAVMRCLPPVRRPVPLARGDAASGNEALRSFFGGREVALFTSGTAALSAAIAQACASHAVPQPEVIIPAYGCPDLVAACLAASACPRLVDTLPDAWGYEPNSLHAALSPRTAAILAVNLMGIGDDSAALARQASAAGATLVQDSAQCLPRSEHHWDGDFVVLSFGRGKPLNLLRGGALIMPRQHQNAVPGGYETLQGRARVREILLSSRLAAVAFNFATLPPVYYWVARALGERLGATRFRPLRQATLMPPRFWRQVGRAFDSYRRQPTYSAAPWSAALEEWRSVGITRLSAPGSALENTELLRLPLLAPTRAARDGLVAALNHHGLGASALYGTALHQTPDIPASVAAQGPFPNATALADRLFTLPTHRGVTRQVVQLARSVVSEWTRTAYTAC